ncbi:MAG: DUF6364 family protein [Candidatus Methylacidiphilales bacterium]
MNMKLRQTFTLSPDVSARARDYARREGVSLSSLVEQLLRQKTGLEDKVTGKTSGGVSFAKRWAGRGKWGQGDDLRARRLRDKYKH